jgi:hypothetical protein
MRVMESARSAEDRGKVLEKRVGRKELAISIQNVLSLLRRPFEDEK